MLLIEIFSDYVYNQKDLKEYVEVRKSIHERGEFNDASLIQAQENLDKLKVEDKEIYDLMYETLFEYKRLNRGHPIEYPINFVREILSLSKTNMSPQKVYENYRSGLKHYENDA